MSDTIKVNLSKPANDLSTASDTIKVDLSKPKTEETDAVQEQTTNETVLQDEQPEMGLQEVVEGNEESENSTEQEEEVVTLGEVSVDSQEESKPIEKTIEATNKVELPENVEKLVDFMKETGGTMQDYIRLNTDYSTVDSDVLLKEYYKQTKSHLDNVEIDFLMEDKFDFDEDIDEERDIRNKISKVLISN